MGKNIRTEAVDHLFEAILCLKDKEECYTFFEDVCTINELLSLSQRFEVAKMLIDKRTYLDISEKTGASTATISRVNRSLNYGICQNESKRRARIKTEIYQMATYMIKKSSAQKQTAVRFSRLFFWKIFYALFWYHQEPSGRSAFR